MSRVLEGIAVFSRNHRGYLEEAAGQGPKESTVFRARARWATAERAIARFGALPIYFAPVGAEGQVEYVAELCGVLLDPVPRSTEAANWLSRVLPDTASEGLWDPPVNTLYEIRACKALMRPFPMTRLVKVSDGKPISPDYGYSYSVVRDPRT